MMGFDERNGFYKSVSTPVKRERERATMACVVEAEDLSLPSKKIKRSGNSSSRGMCDRTDYSRLPEGTFLKTGVITQVMDVQEPISKLRTMLENHLGIDLSTFQIWLQDQKKMYSQETLGEQCTRSEGMAQVKVEIKQGAEHNRINIIDVLKFPDDYVDADVEIEEDNSDDDSPAEDLSISGSSSVEENINSETGPSKWVVSEDVTSLFPIYVPNDPLKWTEVQITHWLRWAMKEFNIREVSRTFWDITGAQLCKMSFEEFRTKVPEDPQNLFWTHIEYLRTGHLFAVLDKNYQHSNPDSPPHVAVEAKRDPIKAVRKPRTPSSSSSGSTASGSAQISGKRPTLTGHNGQIQLWQFLLELLRDDTKRDKIQWVGSDGEFKLNDPEMVAQMWGERKNKPKMNYEKLSRALRYYYHDGMIAKVHGRRFVYKFEKKLKEIGKITVKETLGKTEVGVCNVEKGLGSVEAGLYDVDECLGNVEEGDMSSETIKSAEA